MPTFEIEQYELHATKNRVQAASEAEAISKLFNGEATRVEESLEFIEVATDVGLPVDEHPELADQLVACGVSVGSVVIPSIRAIRRID
jgi:hypothetical protein